MNYLSTFSFSPLSVWAALCLLGGLGICRPVAGEESVEWQALDREAAVRQALRGNLELRAAEWAIRKAAARLRWSGRLTPPVIELSGSTDRFGLDEDESALEIGIAQRFPVTDRLAREKAVSRLELAMAEAEVAEARRRLIAEVERAFVEARSAEEEVALLVEIRNLLGGFVETLEREAAQGTISVLDVNQAKLERQQIENDLRSNRADLGRRMSLLKTLLGASDSTSLALVDDLKLPDKGPATIEVDPSRNRRPEFQLSVLRENQAKAELALAESGRWEDIVVRLFAESEVSEDQPNGLERNRFVGIGVSIPLPLRSERVRDEPLADLGQAEDRSRALALKIENEIAASIRVRDELLEIARATSGETLALAEENLQAISEAYAGGQIELLKYLRAQEQVIRARRSALAARVAHELSEVDLRAAAALHPEIYASREIEKHNSGK